MTLAKARALVELAAHPDTPPNEARAAAMRACRMLREENLLDPSTRPGTGNGDESFTITTHLQVVGEDACHYFVKRATPWTQLPQGQRTLTVPKSMIVEATWMMPAQKRKCRYHDAVIEKLVVRMSWFERATGWRF